MGQQQLLLIALSVLIVGAAVAVGVNMFQEGSEQAQVEPFYQTASMAATNFASFLKKPRSMGGLSGDISNFSGDETDWSRVLGIPADENEADGIYIMSTTEYKGSVQLPGSTSPTADVSHLAVQLGHSSSDLEGTCVLIENGDVVWDDPASGADYAGISGSPARPTIPETT